MAPDLSGKPPAIPLGALVLVTGVTGYIGTHVADQLLQARYRVRGTARDTSKAEWVKEMFDEKYGKGKFETVVVADMAHAGAFDEACKGVSGVAHVASDVSFSPDPNKVIPPVITGAVNAASAAAKESSVKRFVYTSSSAAILTPKPNVEYKISTDDWNEEDVAAAWKPPPYEADRATAVYAASKTQAEQELWKFVQERKPGFVLNTVIPNFNIGSILSDKQSASSGGLIKSIIETGTLDAVKIFPPQWMVNVQDTARLHVLALIDPDVTGERILAFAHPFSWNDVLACLRKLLPDRKFPQDNEREARDMTSLDNSRGAQLLRKSGRPGWTGLEQSLKDNTVGL